tara:strand:+ start:296 stop:643 length:348 start_codon:yes stop_codon:yes gene_type:complete
MFKPIFLNRLEWELPVDKERESAYVSHSGLLEETIRYHLPEGVSVRALPKPYVSESSFSSYVLNCDKDGSDVTVSRKWKKEYEVIERKRYLEVVDYYDGVMRSDGLPVVVEIGGQ